jgi:WD40 repeat protein
LRESFVEQARAERLAGNRSRSLDALRKAAEIRQDDDLRHEATSTIVRPGLHFIGEFPIDRERLGGHDRVGSGPVVSSDGRLAAVRWNRDPKQDASDFIEVLEIPTGKLLATKYGQYHVVAFRPRTAQVALIPIDRPSCVVLWDPKKDQEVAQFKASGKLGGDGGQPQLGAEFSTDGSHLVTLTMQPDNKRMQVWNLDEMREAKAPIRGEFARFLSGTELLFKDDGRVKIWECRTGLERIPAEFRNPGTFSIYRTFWPQALIASHGRLTGNLGDGVRIWDMAAGRQIAEMPGLAEDPNRVDISPNGRFVVCQFFADKGKLLRVWDQYVQAFVNPMICPRGQMWKEGFWVNGARVDVYRSFNSDGSLLASRTSTGSDNFLCIWDTTSGDVVTSLPIYGEFWWSSDGRRLIVHTTFYSLGCWEVTQPPPSYETGSPVKSLSLNKAGNRLAVNEFVCEVVGSEQGLDLVGWKALNGAIPQFVGNDECWVIEPQRSVDPFLEKRRGDLPVVGASIVGLMGSAAGLGSLLANSPLVKPLEPFPTWGFDTELRQLSPPERKLALPNLPITDYPFHAKLAESTAKDAMEKNKDLVSYQYGFVSTTRSAFSPEGPFLLREGFMQHRRISWKGQGQRGSPEVSTSNSTMFPIVELWNYQEGKRLADLNHPPYLSWWQFSPDGRRLATWIGESLQILDTANCQVERELRPGSSMIWRGAPTFSPDGRHLLASYGDARKNDAERVGLFEVDNGREAQAWQVKKGDGQVLGLNPDSTVAASGGEAKMIHLWDVATGREFTRWQGHDGKVTALLFSRDGQFLYSGSQDGTLKIWNLPFIRKELKALGMDW